VTANGTRNEPNAPACGSDRFAHEFARILGVPVSAVMAAIEASPSHATGNKHGLVPEAASETARLICACLAEKSENGAAAVADQLSGMEFQCEFGPEATTDSRWNPERRDPRKDFFGTQLSAVLESAGARDDDRTGLSPAIRSGLSLGWTPNGQALGLLQFARPQRRVTYLYSSSPMFATLSKGIRLNELVLNTSVRVDVDPDRLQHLARVMRDVSQSPEMQNPVHPPESSQLEDSMWRQGWGLFKDSDGVYQIGRIDADRRFASDDEAIKHVKSLAAMGEPLHEHAMRFCLTSAPLEPGQAASP
jgi:hypothetical protein